MGMGCGGWRDERSVGSLPLFPPPRPNEGGFSPGRKVPHPSGPVPPTRRERTRIGSDRHPEGLPWIPTHPLSSPTDPTVQEGWKPSHGQESNLVGRHAHAPRSQKKRRAKLQIESRSDPYHTHEPACGREAMHHVQVRWHAHPTKGTVGPIEGIPAAHPDVARARARDGDPRVRVGKGMGIGRETCIPSRSDVWACVRASRTIHGVEIDPSGSWMESMIHRGARILRIAFIHVPPYVRHVRVHVFHLRFEGSCGPPFSSNASWNGTPKIGWFPPFKTCHESNRRRTRETRTDPLVRSFPSFLDPDATHDVGPSSSLHDANARLTALYLVPIAAIEIRRRKG
eukprot:scaffold310_cov335-Pavlova_lutheri.AAC.84